MAVNLDDLRTTIANLNVNTPKGNFDGPAQSFAINANDQIRDPNDYLNSVVAYRNGAPVLLSRRRDRRDRRRRTARLSAWMNATPALHRQHPAPAGRERHSGRRQHQEAAADADARRCRRRSTITPLTDRTTTIRASVSDVEFELALAVGLVVLVIFLFLRNIPATIIPSLVGAAVARRRAGDHVPVQFQPRQSVADGADRSRPASSSTTRSWSSRTSPAISRAATAPQRGGAEGLASRSASPSSR